jgi:hypothetical protein
MKNIAASIIEQSNQDKRARPWKSYAMGNTGNAKSGEWVKTDVKVNALTNAFPA